MTVLGIDPGIATVGFGIVRARGAELYHVRHGTITTPPEDSLQMRLASIYDDIRELIKAFNPAAIAVERLFWGTNVTTAINVSQGRGVILLAAQHCGQHVFEYTPLQVKIAVTGYGKADKRQVTEMVTRLLKLSSAPKPDDAADALAIAICQIHSAGSSLHLLNAST